jgi:PTH2 family peptidyl-tRNA hydrolase
MSEMTSAVVITTSIVALISGFGLGVYSTRGWLISPDLKAEREANFKDPVESEESDIDEDDTLLDHAPNWANGEEADRRQGLRASAQSQSQSQPQSQSGRQSLNINQNEECKLVLVVRSDLGMTKGGFLFFSNIFPRSNRT